MSDAFICRRGGGSGAGGELTVNAPAGVTVIVVNNTTSKTHTKTANSSGKAVFKGLPEGTYKVHMEEGSNSTAPVSVEVSYKASTTLAWFSANIIAKYPPGFVCTCSSGTTTLTASNTSGSYTFNVNSAGPWTIKYTDGAISSSKTTSTLTNGGTVTVSLDFVLYNGTAGFSSKVNFKAQNSTISSSTSGGTGVAPSVSISGGTITITNSNTNYSMGIYIDNAGINMTRYKTLQMTGSISSPDGEGCLGVWTSKTPTYMYDAVAAQWTKSATNPGCSVDSLTGTYYIGVCVRKNTGTKGVATISKLVLVAKEGS